MGKVKQIEENKYYAKKVYKLIFFLYKLRFYTKIKELIFLCQKDHHNLYVNKREYEKNRDKINT